MRRLLYHQWHPVGAMVELEAANLPDICTVDPRGFGQKLPRSPKECADLARFIADAPLMYFLHVQNVQRGNTEPEIVELIERHRSLA